VIFYASAQIVIDPLIRIVLEVLVFIKRSVFAIICIVRLCDLNNNNNINNHMLVLTISNRFVFILVRSSSKRLENTVIGQHNVHNIYDIK